jgi:hypothetical protein
MALQGAIYLRKAPPATQDGVLEVGRSDSNGLEAASSGPLPRMGTYATRLGDICAVVRGAKNDC